MLDQIKVDLLRIRKSKLFYFLLLAQILLSILMANYMIKDTEFYIDPKSPEEVCLEIMQSFGMLIGFTSVVISIKLAILEKRAGLLRNKIIIGVRKSSIFTSKVLFNYLLSILLYVVHLIAVLIVCAIKHQATADAETVLKLSAIYLLWMAFFSILTAILGLCFSDEIISIIFSFAFVWVLTMLPGILASRIRMEKYQGKFILDVMKFIRRLVPYTYMVELETPDQVAKALSYSVVPALSLFVILFTIGCFAFSRKEFN